MVCAEQVFFARAGTVLTSMIAIQVKDVASLQRKVFVVCLQCLLPDVGAVEWQQMLASKPLAEKTTSLLMTAGTTKASQAQLSS